MRMVKQMECFSKIILLHVTPGNQVIIDSKRQHLTHHMFCLVSLLYFTILYGTVHSGIVPMGNKPLALSHSVTQTTHKSVCHGHFLASGILHKAFQTSSSRSIHVDSVLTPLLGSPELHTIDKHN